MGLNLNLSCCVVSRAGTVFIVEEPFMLTLHPHGRWHTDHCHFCLKLIWRGIPCGSCVFVSLAFVMNICAKIGKVIRRWIWRQSISMSLVGMKLPWSTTMSAAAFHHSTPCSQVTVALLPYCLQSDPQGRRKRAIPTICGQFYLSLIKTPLSVAHLAPRIFSSMSAEWKGVCWIPKVFAVCS